MARARTGMLTIGRVRAFTQEQREAILTEVMERIEEANVEGRRITWREATEGLTLDGEAIHHSTIRSWMNSDWGQRLHAEWSATSKRSARMILDGIFARGLERLAQIVDTGESREVIPAMKALLPYFAEADLIRQQVNPQRAGSMHILIQQHGGTISVKRPDEDVVDAEVKQLPQASQSAPQPLAQFQETAQSLETVSLAQRG